MLDSDYDSDPQGVQMSFLFNETVCEKQIFIFSYSTEVKWTFKLNWNYFFWEKLAKAFQFQIKISWNNIFVQWWTKEK